eukprot:CAMPEP_0202961296 /NCGR_PEP_ID=MMETSP1396-20130829/5351_1 /ASSEMBLY_ACC=CAM_ASM_000872 /TAXON_ID= /ORGANISM="Pseudokeronopsis sp., Strain Brazil" /LENGTH=235 /DNA_ID=CAMNT_0049681009 /DNA_START=54 /DNA_END=761 /DNA_ORIENTATION=+
MGGSVSTTQKVAERVDMNNVELEVIPFVMPIYYVEEPMKQSELDAAMRVWKMILNNRSEHFLAMKRLNVDKDVQEAENCMDYFMHNFYIRLFDIHPNCKKLFHRSIHKQGSFFLRFLTMCVAEVSEPEKLDKTMENLANIHNKLGVKAVEYGIAGEALFHTIAKCVGPEYTSEVASGWAKIYSIFLKYLIPYVVRFELAHKDISRAIAAKRSGQEVATDMFVSKHESTSAAAATV